MPTKLASLSIRNLALVEELHWELASGFLAVTGETGAGKSVIVGALNLILGERADRSLLRAGADQCTVEAVFELEDTEALNLQLEEQGIEPCSDSQLILKRVLTKSGSGRQFINCSTITLSVLKAIAEPLVDLHGPHDHQSLLSTDKQLELLDAYAGADDMRTKFQTDFRELNRLRAEREELERSESSMVREIDLLSHQIREIESANLRADEEDELLERYTLATNAQQLSELAMQINQLLSESDEAAIVRLAEVQRLFRDLARVDPATAPMADANEKAVIELEELARSVQDYAERLDLDPRQSAELEERVNLLENLKRKYGANVAEVIAYRQEAEERLKRIESRSEELERLALEIQNAWEQLREAGSVLSRKRSAAAPKLAADVTRQLRDLGFRKSKFAVSLQPLEKAGPRGMETVEFLFAPNPGEPCKPLKSVASSGEISRVMLAVKTSLASQDRVPLLVFDEIDANVGGEIAHAVAGKMKSLARAHQVLCISHLPQVAAAGDGQYVVTKVYENNRTVSRLTEVAGNARVEEIARMLGGRSDSAIAHAKVLLEGGK